VARRSCSCLGIEWCTPLAYRRACERKETRWKRGMTVSICRTARRSICRRWYAPSLPASCAGVLFTWNRNCKQACAKSQIGEALQSTPRERGPGKRACYGGSPSMNWERPVGSMLADSVERPSRISTLKSVVYEYRRKFHPSAAQVVPQSGTNKSSVFYHLRNLNFGVDLDSVLGVVVEENFSIDSPRKLPPPSEDPAQFEELQRSLEQTHLPANTHEGILV